VAAAVAVAPAPATAVTLPAAPPAVATTVAPAPTMTAANHISPVSSAYAMADTVAMPEHQPGDTIIVFVSRTGASTPALQAGWTNIVNGNRNVGTGNWSARIAYKVATSSSETVGTWATANVTIVLVYRGVTAIGVATTGSGAANKTITYPAATLQGTNGQSWVVRFVHGGGSSSLTADLTTNPVPGWVQRAGTPDEALTWDKGAPVTANPTADTQVTNTTNYWFAATVELRSAD